jgi:hypothetical protein
VPEARNGKSNGGFMSEGRASACAGLLRDFRSLDEQICTEYNQDTENMGADYDDRIRFLEARVQVLGAIVDELLEALSEY